MTPDLNPSREEDHECRVNYRPGFFIYTLLAVINATFATTLRSPELFGPPAVTFALLAIAWRP